MAIINISSRKEVGQRTYGSEHFGRLRIYVIQMEVKKEFGMRKCSQILHVVSMTYTFVTQFYNYN